jgi:hypothetical protein
VAKCALNPDGSKRVVAIEDPRHSDDSVQPQQRQSHRDIIEVNFTPTQLSDQRPRQGVHIYFQADSERGVGTDTWTDAAESLSLDRLMQL